MTFGGKKQGYLSLMLYHGVINTIKRGKNLKKFQNFKVNTFKTSGNMVSIKFMTFICHLFQLGLDKIKH